MEIKDLKKNDIIEYSHTISRNLSEVEIKRDIVSMVISDRTVVFGGTFSFDYENLKILKVWRESESKEYVLTYESQ